MNGKRYKYLKNLVNELTPEDIDVVEKLIKFKKWRDSVQHIKNTERKINEAYLSCRESGKSERNS